MEFIYIVTSKGGLIVACFSSYSEAKDYAKKCSTPLGTYAKCHNRKSIQYQVKQLRADCCPHNILVKNSDKY
jgi:Rad3-related DNA helicase